MVILAARVLAGQEPIVFGMFAIALLFTDVSVYRTNSFMLSRQRVKLQHKQLTSVDASKKNSIPFHLVVSTVILFINIL